MFLVQYITVGIYGKSIKEEFVNIFIDLPMYGETMIR